MAATAQHLSTDCGKFHLRIPPCLPLPLETGALVIVRGGAVKGGLQGGSLCHILTVSHAVAGEEAALLIKGDDAVVIDQEVDRLIRAVLHSHIAILTEWEHPLGMLGKRELIACHKMVCWDERLILQCAILDIEEDILADGIDGGELDLQSLCLPGPDGRAGHRAGLHLLPVYSDGVIEGQVVKRAEVIVILDQESDTPEREASLHGGEDRLVGVLCLHCIGLRHAGAVEESVVAEVIVARVVVVPVAAVASHDGAIRLLHILRLVDKVPDKAPLQDRVGMEEIHVVGHAALAIPHSVSVLHKYVRLGGMALRICHELTRPAVHIPIDVGIGTIYGTLKYDWSGGVELLDCRSGDGEVLSISGLIGH